MPIDFAEQRLKMVDGQLRTMDVTDPAILHAMGLAPRESFLPSVSRFLAYIDEDISISSPDKGNPRYLMKPAPFAKLLQLADISDDDVVLDIGCGVGYSSAVLSLLAGSVIAVEDDPALVSMAAEALSEHGYDSAVIVEGPLGAGYASEAPYDVIFLNGAIDEIPTALIEQLKDGGRIVGVVGTGNTGQATLWTKSNGNVSARQAFNLAVRPLPGFQREPSFEF